MWWAGHHCGMGTSTNGRLTLCEAFQHQAGRTCEPWTCAQIADCWHRSRSWVQRWGQRALTAPASCATTGARSRAGPGTWRGRATGVGALMASTARDGCCAELHCPTDCHLSGCLRGQRKRSLRGIRDYLDIVTACALEGRQPLTLHPLVARFSATAAALNALNSCRATPLIARGPFGN